MQLQELLIAVVNDRVQFATMRPPGARSAVLERRVVVTAPAELVELSRSGRLETLGRLVELLRDPGRAWAATVVLAAMTGEDAKTVDAFAADPDRWLASLGRGAYERWSKWLRDHEDRLRWDRGEQRFVMDE